MIHLALLVSAAAPTAWVAPHDDDAAALRALSRRIEAEADNADMYLARARLFRERGLHEFALADLDHALGLGAPTRRVRLDRANILTGLGRTTEAIEELDRLLAEDPADATARRHRAERLTAQGRTSEAARDLAIALETAPDPATYLALATLLADRPPSDTAPFEAHLRAVELLDEGLRRLGPVPSLERAALVHEERAAAFDRALARIDRMLESAPRTEVLLHDRARVLEALGRTREALAAQRSALEAIGRLHPRYRESAAISNLTDAVRREIDRLSSLESEVRVPTPANQKGRTR